MSIDLEWEKFLGGPTASPSDRLHATMSGYGRITFNRNLFERLGRPEAVSLFFNRRLRQIAIQKAGLEMPEAFPVGTMQNRSTRYINASSFCSHYGIKVRNTHRFIAPHFTDDGKLVLDLNQTVIISQPRKNKMVAGG